MSQVNFEEIRERVSIKDVVKMLELDVTEQVTKDRDDKDVLTLRCACPACKKGGDRAVVVTPELGLFCCFSAPKNGNKFLGGDCIALVSHVLSIPLKDAAEGIAKYSGLTEQLGKSNKEVIKSLEGLDESKFNLDYKHENVSKLGVSNDWAELLNLGYAHKGMMKKSIGIPLRDTAGVLHGFCWYSEDKGLVFHARFFMPIDLSE